MDRLEEVQRRDKGGLSPETASTSQSPSRNCSLSSELQQLEQQLKNPLLLPVPKPCKAFWKQCLEVVMCAGRLCSSKVWTLTSVSLQKPNCTAQSPSTENT